MLQSHVFIHLLHITYHISTITYYVLHINYYILHITFTYYNHMKNKYTITLLIYVRYMKDFGEVIILYFVKLKIYKK